MGIILTRHCVSKLVRFVQDKFTDERSSTNPLGPDHYQSLSVERRHFSDFFIQNQLVRVKI